MRSTAVQAPDVLLGRATPPPDGPGLWPLDAPPVQAGPALTSAAGVAAELTATGSVVAALPPTWPDAALTQAAWNLVTLLMRPSPQYDTGELVCSVQVREGATGASHYSATAAAGDLHTDGSLLDRPPDYGVLLCLSEADSGGETILVAAEEIRSHLDETGQGLSELLAAPQPFATDDDGPRTVRQWGPVLAGPPGQTHMRYLRRYLLAGWQRAGQQAPPGLGAALAAVDRIAADQARQRAYLLRRGDLLIWLNPRFIHGRRAFAESSRRRRLVRIYGEHDAGRPAAAPAVGAEAGQ